MHRYRVHRNVKISSPSQQQCLLKIFFLALLGNTIPSSHSFIIPAIDNALFSESGSLTHKKKKGMEMLIFLKQDSSLV